VARAERYLRPSGSIVVLVKPQFEAGRERLGSGGVVRDGEVHRAILREVRGAFEALGLGVKALTGSPLYGPAGNREFLAELRRGADSIDDARIDAVLDELPAR
jgi:23S rRNA (cytidine1920-2'-O)/16S rRNA (cytidine1409-2'-O)-methyltransferase